MTLARTSEIEKGSEGLDIMFLKNKLQNDTFGTTTSGIPTYFQKGIRRAVMEDVCWLFATGPRATLELAITYAIPLPLPFSGHC